MNYFIGNNQYNYSYHSHIPITFVRSTAHTGQWMDYCPHGAVDGLLPTRGSGWITAHTGQWMDYCPHGAVDGLLPTRGSEWITAHTGSGRITAHTGQWMDESFRLDSLFCSSSALGSSDPEGTVGLSYS